ncbi:hypothetical protein Tco_0140903 [Tanacetum coccineum]
MVAIQAFFKKYDHIPPREKSMALLLAEERFLKVKQAFEEEQNQPEIIQQLLLQLIQDLQLLDEILPKQKKRGQISKFRKNKKKRDDDNDDDDYNEESIISMNADMSETPSLDVITTSSPIEEPKDSFIMEDEDIDTIPEKESDKEKESSVENLFHIPSKSKVTFDNESECDLPIFDDSPLDVFDENCVIFSRPLFDSYGDTTSSEYSSDDESILEEDVLEDIDSTNYLIDSIIDFSHKIDPLLEEFAGELALINPIQLGIDEVDFYPEGNSCLVEKLSYDNSSPRPLEELNSEDIIYFDIEEKNTGSTTTHADISLPNILGELTRVVVEDIFGEPRVHMPNVLTTLPTLYLDLDFTLSTDFSRSDLVVSFPSRNRNKSFDLGISIEVQSKRFLSLNKISISFISDPLSPVLETLLPFSSENKNKVFNPGILVSKRRNLLISYLIGALKFSRSFIISLMKA